MFDGSPLFLVRILGEVKALKAESIKKLGKSRENINR